MKIAVIGDALDGAEVVLLAVPGQAVPGVVNEQGAALAGKVVIDAVNRIGAPEFDSRTLLPLWFALVKPNGGDRKVVLRIVR